MEKWKQFEETDTEIYLVSTKGNLKKIDKTTNEESSIKVRARNDGRRTYSLSNGKHVYVYRLVAEAFIPNPENKPTVNHIRGLDAGDGVDNLEWMTHAEQTEHARRIGLRTPGNTPAIVLNSNGIVIARYNNIGEALTSYDGKNIYYNKDTQIIGNVVVMKQSYYDGLSEGELDNICYECFQQMVEFAYIVDGRLAGNLKETAELTGYTSNDIPYRAKNKLSINVKGHTVSRLKNWIGVFNEDVKKEKM
ncbi:NUMOD4 domain-containing protein [Bacillus thuringiensis]|uniref:NUMOD4 domain-containing protein n=1 Tax=Bacillus thuringiensis TaxID=1428 RepID=UPI003709AD3D